MTTPKIDNKKSSFFRPTESWDDFLDFSRMRIPSEGVVLKRWLENLVHFSGNYLWISLVLTLAWGVLLNGRILAAILVLVASAFVGKALFVHASMAEASLKHDRKGVEDVPDSAKVNNLVTIYAFMCSIFCFQPRIPSTALVRNLCYHCDVYNVCFESNFDVIWDGCSNSISTCDYAAGC